MKIKTSELTGTALDWAVAKCEIQTHPQRYLEPSQFIALQGDGKRGDWISTGDVQRWLLYIEDLGRMYP